MCNAWIVEGIGGCCILYLLLYCTVKLITYSNELRENYGKNTDYKMKMFSVKTSTNKVLNMLNLYQILFFYIPNKVNTLRDELYKVPLLNYV